MSATATRSEARTITLKSDVVLVWRHPRTPTMDLDISRSAGSQVSYYSEDHGTFTRHVCFVEEDGRRYESVKDIAKPSVPAPAPAPAPETQAPASEQTVQAVERTAQTAANAVSVLVERETARTMGYADQTERRIRNLDRIADTLRGKVYQVNYYVPIEFNGIVENPSRIFRRHGFRLDGSNWVFTEAGLNHADVQAVFSEWDKLAPVEADSSLPGFRHTKRVRYWAIQYTSDQLAAMRETARTQLAEELQELHRSLINRIESASESLRKAQEALDASEQEGNGVTEKQRQAPLNVHNGALRATIKEACERFEMCLHGAELFDDTGSLDAIFQATREAIRSEALAVNATLRARRVKTVDVPKTIG